MKRGNMTNYLSVSDLTKYLKLKFDKDPYLERVFLTGQVSNFRKRPNHQYFSIKDDKSVIQATIWGAVYQKLGFDLEEGMKINVIGRIQLYAPNGSYSIVIEKVDPDGVGALALQFEQLKNRLAKEGFFDSVHKQALPKFPKKIGVVTSPSGAVIRDIITTVSRRFPGIEVLLFPTKVQGEGASQEIATNIRRANTFADLDVLIIGRGGGSIEDLWAFNEEIVVHAIFESRLPIISSVGHETDVTLSDYVADCRAATPTAAAELATSVTKMDCIDFLSNCQTRMQQATIRRIKTYQEFLDKLNQSVIFRQPERLYDSYLLKLDNLKNRLLQEVQKQVNVSEQQHQLLKQRLIAYDLPSKINYLTEKIAQEERYLINQVSNIYKQNQNQFEKLQTTLLTLDVNRILARGYAIVSKNDYIVSDIRDIKENELLSIQLKNGKVEVEAKHVTIEKNI